MIRAVAAAVCVAAASALLLLAMQARRWERALRTDDLRFQVTPLAGGMWHGPDGVGARGARRLLGVRDDVAFRESEQLFARVHVPARNYADETERLSAFGRAQSTLESLARSDPSAERRSRAANLLGVLLWEDAAGAPDNAPLLQRQALESFRRAVRASPGDDEAKWNLELLSTVLQPQSDRRRDTPQQSGGTGLKGAGAGRTGRGY